MSKYRFNFGSAIQASIVATIIMTLVMWLFGTNLMLALGMIAGKTGGMAYLYGGIIHFAIGIVYGLIYALIFAPLLKKLPGFLAGALYSLIPFIIAVFFMGTFLSTIKSVLGGESTVTSKQMESIESEKRSNYRQDGSYDHSDYNAPMQQQDIDENSNGMNYRHDGSYNHNNYDAQKAVPKPQAKPRGSSGETKTSGWLMSLIFHLVYGIFLGWLYRPRIEMN